VFNLSFHLLKEFLIELEMANPVIGTLTCTFLAMTRTHVFFN
jgi:hypothetical protein